MKYGFLLLVILGVALFGCATDARYNYDANLALRDGDYEAALRGYQQAQVEAPNRAEFYYNVALAHVELNEFNRAIDALQQALQTAEDDLRSRVYYNLGNTYAAIGRYREAIDAYRAGLRLNPEDEDMRYNLEVAQLLYVPPTPTAQEQQTEPDEQDTDPEVTPTNDPGGFDGPTPTPPPIDFDPTMPPEGGGADDTGEQGATPMPRPQGALTIEEAQRILDQIEQDQQSVREFRQETGGAGDNTGPDW